MTSWSVEVWNLYSGSHRLDQWQKYCCTHSAGWITRKWTLKRETFFFQHMSQASYSQWLQLEAIFASFILFLHISVWTLWWCSLEIWGLHIFKWHSDASQRFYTLNMCRIYEDGSAQISFPFCIPHTNRWLLLDNSIRLSLLHQQLPATTGCPSAQCGSPTLS